MEVTIKEGDCLIEMPKMSESSVDAIVSDPPYGLSFMGRTWDHGVPGVPFWAAALRVLKPGAHMLAFGGTRTYHRLTVAIEDAGFEIRDCLGWIYGSGFPKSLDISKAIEKLGNPAAEKWSGFGTALKPAWEPVILGRKPLIGTVASNVLEYGTGGLNIDRCRISGPKPLRENTIGKEGLFGLGSQVAIGESQEGRFPANLIHDGSPEVLAAFPESSSTGGVKTPQHDRALRMGRTSGTGANAGGLGDSGSAARFFYCSKASRADRDLGCESLPLNSPGDCTLRDDGSAGLESPRAGAGRTSGARNDHPTVKPTDLLRYLCRLICPPGGTICDPFMGSGSTGKAAIAEGFSFIGIEIDPHYCEIAAARLSKALEEIQK